MADSPTQRTLRECRKRGWIAQVVEHWVPSFRSRQVTDSAVAMAESDGSMQQVINSVRAMRRGGPGQRKDLFGCIDVVALDLDRQQIVGLQACAVGSQSKRRMKILTECLDEARAWLHCGGRLEVWGWGSYKVKGGGKAKRWKVTETEITDADVGVMMAPHLRMYEAKQ